MMQVWFSLGESSFDRQQAVSGHHVLGDLQELPHLDAAMLEQDTLQQ